jgi:hypothetical protein
LLTSRANLAISHQKIPFAGYAQQRGRVLESLLGRLSRPHASEVLTHLPGLYRFSLGNFTLQANRTQVLRGVYEHQ